MKVELCKCGLDTNDRKKVLVERLVLHLSSTDATEDDDKTNNSGGNAEDAHEHVLKETTDGEQT